MPKRKRCSQCQEDMELPEFMKTRIPLPPSTDCPECEERRKHIALLNFAKVYVCVHCGNMVVEKLSPSEIKKNKNKFHWGSMKMTPESTTKIMERAEKEHKEEEESKKITDEIIKIQPTVLIPEPPKIIPLTSEKAIPPISEKIIPLTTTTITIPLTVTPPLSPNPLEVFMNKIKECIEVERAYLTEPPQASHILEMGWKILELHVVPIDRPPYLELERLLSEMPHEWEGISELNLIKVTDSIKIIMMVENPRRLPHV